MCEEKHHTLWFSHSLALMYFVPHPPSLETFNVVSLPLMIGNVTVFVFVSVFYPSLCWTFRYFCPSFLIYFLTYCFFHKLLPTFSVHSGICSWYWITRVDHLALLFTPVSLTVSLYSPFLEIFSNLASNLLLIWKKTSAIKKHDTKWKKPDTEGHTLCDSLYVNCPARADP